MRRLTETDTAPWVQGTLLSPTRTRPIVAVTSHPHTDRAWIDAAELSAALGDLAEVVFLVTGEATWALSESLPPRLDVYGGAVRIWWPGLEPASDPYAHRLYFVRSQHEAGLVFAEIVAAVRERAGPPPAGDAAAVVPHRTAPLEQPEPVRVTAVSAGRVEVASATKRGPVVETDLTPAIFADAVQVGCEFEARPLLLQGDGTWAFSTLGLLPSPWQRFVDEVRTGDIVIGRVQNVLAPKKIVFVDMLPGVVGVCHLRELDYTFVDDMNGFVRPGELLAFEILQLVDSTMSLQLSRKRALGQEPRQLPALVEGGRPFVWKEGMPQFENLRQMQR
ncbi:MAG TPA: hypothetical protein VK348_07275, partial [Planctomycetota bacterium]|nr:hypothetical protein [Planctomycetota bacterium]